MMSQDLDNIQLLIKTEVASIHSKIGKQTLVLSVLQKNDLLQPKCKVSQQMQQVVKYLHHNIKASLVQVNMSCLKSELMLIANMSQSESVERA